MTVTRRRNGFQVYVGKGTRRWRRTLSSREEARALEAEWRADLLNGREPFMNEEAKQAAVTEKALGWWVGRTYDLYWQGTKSVKTAKVNIGDVVEVLGEDLPIADITQSKVNDLIALFKSKGLASATINRKLAALGKVLTLALDEGAIHKKPKMSRLKEDNSRTKFFTKEELDSLFGYLDADGAGDIGKFCRFLLETGLRVSEALCLEWEDILEMDDRTRRQAPSVIVRKSKNEEQRVVPLTHEAYHVLIYGGVPAAVEGRNTRPWGDITQSKLTFCWNKARKSAGMEGDSECVPHSLRHTCASRLARSGVDILTIKKWLGHKTLAMTLRYSHLSQGQLDTAKDALNNWKEDGAE